MADTNDQASLTAEESALLSSMENDTGTEAGSGADTAGTPAKPAADAPAGSEAEGEDKGQKGKTVPLEALHESRAEQKRLRDELKAANDRQTIMEQRTNLILERLTPKAPDPVEEKIPDINEDPAGHLAAVLAKTGKTVEQLLAEGNERKTRETQSAAVGNIMRQAIAQEQTFETATPDYRDASAHLIQSRDTELSEMGYSDPAMRMQIINNEKLAIADQALKQGKNPAAVVYAMAKLRGYTKKAPAIDPPADQGKTAVERVQNIDKGQEQSRSLSDTRGQGPSPLTATRLLEMSESEFAKYMNTPEGRAAMGA